MGSLKIHAFLAGFVATVSVAQAADLLAPPPPPPMMPASVDVGGNWYLRGDVGVGILDYGKTEGVNVKSAPGTPQTGYVGRSKSLDDQFFIGAGVGYQFNSWLRADVTGEYRAKSNWRYVEQDTNFGPDNYNIEHANVSSIVGLANAYVDLGTWYGLTPFVGAGVGVAAHRFGVVTDTGAGGYAGGFGLSKEKDKTNFAWAIHAGLAYDVSPSLKMELAYRYLNMGDMQTGGVTCASSCPLTTVYKLKDVESQDIKIGMRWMFGAVPIRADYAPEPDLPIVRKY